MLEERPVAHRGHLSLLPVQVQFARSGGEMEEGKSPTRGERGVGNDAKKKLIENWKCDQQHF